MVRQCILVVPMHLFWIQYVVRAAQEVAQRPDDDRITMMLTAVAVALAAVTVVIAVATMFLGMFGIFLGYITFVGKAEIIQKAEAAAKKAAEEYLEHDEGLQELDEPAVEPDEPEENQQAEYGDDV